MELRINKGVGKPVQVGGLQAQYLFIFCALLIGAFLVFVILFMAGVNQWVCIGVGLIAVLVLGKVTFLLSKKYGRYGLMKLQARRSYPSFIISRCSIRKLLKRKQV